MKLELTDEFVACFATCVFSIRLLSQEFGSGQKRMEGRSDWGDRTGAIVSLEGEVRYCHCFGALHKPCFTGL